MAVCSCDRNACHGSSSASSPVRPLPSSSFVSVPASSSDGIVDASLEEAVEPSEEDAVEGGPEGISMASVDFEGPGVVTGDLSVSYEHGASL